MIAKIIKRRLASRLLERLKEVPAVVLLGPRQVGKTTLALTIREQEEAIYLDLESEADRARLSEPELYLKNKLDRLVILDEIHRMPGIFLTLRGLIDHVFWSFIWHSSRLNNTCRSISFATRSSGSIFLRSQRARNGSPTWMGNSKVILR